MTVRIQKWGNSFAIRIPKAYVNEMKSALLFVFSSPGGGVAGPSVYRNPYFFPYSIICPT